MTGLRGRLAAAKDRIGMNRKEWESVRGAMNPYERVMTGPPCVSSADGTTSHPVSRAFFKMWEIMADQPFLLPSPRVAGRFAYLAEAPGAFVQAVVTARLAAGGGRGDSHLGISLTRGSATPAWRLHGGWLGANNVRLTSGADGTGDITRACNIEHLARECAGSCDLVTGDGGVDVSSDFNDQEEKSARLIAAEALACLVLLRPGGGCVIKVFEAWGEDTVDVLSAMMARFDRSFIIKPKTSRPGNSERYLVCGGFRGEPPPPWLRWKADCNGEEPPRPERDAACESYVAAANAAHGASQLEFITSALDRRGGSPGDLSAEWWMRYLPCVPYTAAIMPPPK